MTFLYSKQRSAAFIFLCVIWELSDQIIATFLKLLIESMQSASLDQGWGHG